jgi:hypothetical protein
MALRWKVMESYEPEANCESRAKGGLTPADCGPSNY